MRFVIGRGRRKVRVCVSVESMRRGSEGYIFFSYSCCFWFFGMFDFYGVII